MTRHSFHPDEEATPIADLQPYQRTVVVGRLGYRKVGLRRTSVWLLEDTGGGLHFIPDVVEQEVNPRLRLDFRGPRPHLRPGQRVRVTGTALMLSDRALRMFNPRVEAVNPPSESRVVLFRSYACDECGRPGNWVLDWMGFRGQGFVNYDRKARTADTCPSCGGAGFHLYLAPGWFALPWWTLAMGLLGAVVLGWFIDR